MKTGLPFKQYRVTVTTHKYWARVLSHNTFLVLLYKLLLPCFPKQT
jgi:hypothetical protein